MKFEKVANYVTYYINLFSPQVPNTSIPQPISRCNMLHGNFVTLRLTFSI